MEAATNPNNTNTFPNSLTLHIYKTILLFILISSFFMLKSDGVINLFSDIKDEFSLFTLNF